MENFIKTSINNIREAKDNNKLVLFIGSGVSANSGLPSWNSLIKIFADELGIKDFNSKDDYLKIPQLYYNERGKKEYYDKIIKMFTLTEKPNWIHSELLKLNPSSIITTNYDNLIELATQATGHFFHAVRRNEDLPFAFNDKLIIKMHGDLSLRNIVLKENDYLSYSKNFKLIETFIKALFSSKIILFVGYSANDIDFKIIFQSVKDILGEGFQPSYLLEIGKVFNRLEYDYYKKKGINILYQSSIKETLEDKIIKGEKIYDENKFVKPTTVEGMKLLRFINYINQQDKFEDLIDNYYNKIKVFFNIPYIRPDDLIRNLDKNLDISDNYIISHDLAVVDYLIKIKNDKTFRSKQLKKKNKIREIIDRLKQSGIIGFKYNGDIIFKWDSRYSDTSYMQIETAYMNFNLSYISKNLSISRFSDLSEGNEFIYLSCAFYYFKLGSYLEAYKLLKEISFFSFNQKKYWIYFISEFNKKKLRKLIDFEYNIRLFGRWKDTQTIDSILAEIDSIDLDNIYLNLPNEGKSYVLGDLMNFNFLYKSNQEIDKLITEIEEQKRLVDSDGFTTNNTFERAYNNFLELWLYINKNYFFVEHFSEVKFLYQKFIRGMFLSYYTANKQPRNAVLSFFGRNSGIQKFNYWLLWLAIEYYDHKELYKLIKELSINEISLDNIDIKINLEKAFINLIEYYKQKEFNSDENYNVLNNFLIVFKLFELDEDVLVKIISYYLNSSLFRFNSELQYYFDLLEYSIGKLNNEKILELCNPIITRIMREMIDNNLSLIYIRNLESNNVIYNIVSLCKKNNYKIKIDNGIANEFVNASYNDVINGDKKYFVDVLSTIVIPLSIYYEEEIKQKLREKILAMYFGNNPIITDEIKVKLLFASIKAELIKPKEDVIIEFLKKVYSLVLKYSETKTMPSQVEHYIDYIIDLILMDKLKVAQIKHEMLEKLKENSILFDFIINQKEFDINIFEPIWVSYLPHKYFKKILSDKEKVKNIIRMTYDSDEYNSKQKLVIISKILEYLKLKR